MNAISACLITLNEEKNLPRALVSLQGVADEIVVVDACSTDTTIEIARQHGAVVRVRPWTNYSDQRNFAASQAQHNWILAIDADEELGQELRASLLRWKLEPATGAAYEFPRRAEYLGKWMRHSGWYPDIKPRLYDRRKGKFIGVLHEKVHAEGVVGRLEGDLLHYAYGTLAAHRVKSEAYASISAKAMFQRGQRHWLFPLLLFPTWTLVHTLVLRAAWLDGWRGLLIAWMAARTVFRKYWKLGQRAGRIARGETK